MQWNPFHPIPPFPSIFHFPQFGVHIMEHFNRTITVFIPIFISSVKQFSIPFLSLFLFYFSIACIPLLAFDVHTRALFSLPDSLKT